MRKQLELALLAGWLLMAPPADPEGKWSVDTPIQKWEQMGAYDTAKECESGKLEFLGMTFGKQGKKPEQKMDPATTVLILESRRWANAMRCVPAEHIYPPAVPPK